MVVSAPGVMRAVARHDGAVLRLSRVSASSNELDNSSDEAWAAAGSARITRSVPGSIRLRRSLIRARSRRATRFRTTADPTARETTNPTRTGSLDPRSIGPRCTTNSGVPTLAPRCDRGPRRTAALKSRELRSRWWRGSIVPPDSLGGAIRSGGQFRTALTTPRGQDRTPGAGPHPQAETVLARAAAVVRLVGALAHCSLRDHVGGIAMPLTTLASGFAAGIGRVASRGWTVSQGSAAIESPRRPPHRRLPAGTSWAGENGRPGRSTVRDAARTGQTAVPAARTANRPARRRHHSRHRPGPANGVSCNDRQQNRHPTRRE